VLAQQAELVERSRALGLDPETLGQQQQSPLVRNAGQRVAPRRVIDQHAHVIAVLRQQPGAGNNSVRMHTQIVDRHRRHWPYLRDI
jgi:hypothetical protein